jgi:nitrogen fixation protein FixH
MNRKEVLIIAVTVFLTVIAWSIAEIMHKNSQSKNTLVIGNTNVKSFQIDNKIFQVIENKNP